MSKKYKYLLGIILIVIVVVLFSIFWTHSNDLKKNELITLSNISPPAGWQEVHSDDQSITFEKNSSSTSDIASAIEVDLQQEPDSVETLLNGSGQYNSFAPNQTWNVINGYIVLGVASSNQMTYSIIIRNGNNPDYSYIFSLTYPYLNTPGLSNSSVKSDDVKTLQTLVQNFAQNLPSDISSK